MGQNSSMWCLQKGTAEGALAVRLILIVVILTWTGQALASKVANHYLAFQHKSSKSVLTPEQEELVAALRNGTKDTSYLCQCKEILWGPGPETGTYKGSPVVEEHYALEKKLRLAENLGQDFDIMFYGDSITKRWLDKDSGLPTLNNLFSKYNPLVMGVGGDQVGNLWWRLMHGEVPTRFHPKVVVLLIGTNDLGAIEACARNGDDDLAATVGINSRIKHVAAYLREQLPSSYVVVLGVLPRSGWTLPDQNAWPNRLSPAIEAINNASKALHEEDKYVHWLNCGPAFYNESGLIPELYTDGLHLTNLGYEVLGACLQPTIETLWYQASLPSHVPKNSTLKLPEGSNTTSPSKSEACHDPHEGSSSSKSRASHPSDSAVDSSATEEGDKDWDEPEGEEEEVAAEAETGAAPAQAPVSDDEEPLMFAGRMAVVKPLKALAPIKECVYCERDTYFGGDN